MIWRLLPLTVIDGAAGATASSQGEAGTSDRCAYSELDLVRDLVRPEGARGAIADSISGEAGPEVPAQRVLRHPPVEQRGKALLRRGDGPVELWGEVVDPSLLEPLS